MFAIGMACLVIALAVPEFFHPASQTAVRAVHFFRGMFLGISIVLNLAAVSFRARLRPNRG